MKPGIVAYLSASVMTLAGCGAEPDTANPTSDGSTSLLAELSYSDTGSIQLHESQGNVFITVRGKIGVDDPAEAEKNFGNLSMSELFERAHAPGTDVPEVVRAADARFQDERERFLALVPAPAPETSALVPKSESAFYSKACVTKNTGSNLYVPTWCEYFRAGASLSMVSGTLTSNDRVYAWNETEHEARVSVMIWWSTTPEHFPREVPPWTWMWSAWSLSTSKSWYAKMFIDHYPIETGHMGLTHHNWSPIIK